MDLHLKFALQAAMLLFLGAAVLLAHQTSRTPTRNSGALWFFIGAVCGSCGLALQSERGVWLPIFTIIAGNGLFMLLPCFLTASIAALLHRNVRGMQWAQAVVLAVSLALFSYLTFTRENVYARVFVAFVALVLLLLPCSALLLTASRKTLLPATRTLFALIAVFQLACIAGAISILRGARFTSGSSWSGVFLLAGVAFCILWLDLLRIRDDLETQAMTDPLTGLLNRRAMEIMGEAEVSRSMRKGTCITLLTLDLDYFKQINDLYGHLVGDRALMNMATALRESVVTGDLVFRTGGDEFAVLLSECSTDSAQEMIQRIQQKLATMDFRAHDGRRLTMSVTIGSYTTTAGTQQSYTDIVHASDMDLYLQKKMRAAPPPLEASS